MADLCDTLQGTLDTEGVMPESSQGTRVHRAAVELRQQGIALARLMTALRIPAGESASGDASRTPRRAGVRGVYGIAGGA